MAYPKEIKGTLALLGAAAAAVVAVLLGVLYWSWSGRTEAPQNAAPAQTAQNPAQPQPAPGQPNPSQQAAAKPGAPSEAPAAPAKDAPIVPSFDLVRVEPDGESVIAGRAAPGATIELLRGDQVHARAAADASGLFAIVPPPLPPGSHQVALQSIAPDGTRQRSEQIVTVVIADAKTRPLVTLTTPDKPTVVLSNPMPPEKVAEAKPAEPKAIQGRAEDGRGEPRHVAARSADSAAAGRRLAELPAGASRSARGADAASRDQDRHGRCGGGEALRLRPFRAGCHRAPLPQRELHRAGRGRRRRQSVVLHRRRREAGRLPDPPRRCGSGLGQGQVPRRSGLQRARPGGLRPAWRSRFVGDPGAGGFRRRSASGAARHGLEHAPGGRWPAPERS